MTFNHEPSPKNAGSGSSPTTAPAGRASIIAALVFFLLPKMMLAQPENEAGSNNAHIHPSATKPQSEPRPIKLGGVTLSGSLRLRVENWNWFDTSAADDTYTFGAAPLRLSLGRQTEKIDWQVEGEFPLLINLPEHSIAPAPQGQLGLGASYFAASGRQDGSAVLKQAFVRFKGLGGDPSGSLRIGRFEFTDGGEVTPSDPTLATLKRDHIAHRLIGPFVFSHIQRSFDGIEYARSAKPYNLTLLAARSTEGVFQLNANKELDVDFYYGALTLPFSGAKAASEARAFALHYHDGRNAVKTDNRPDPAADGENIRLTTVGGHFISAMRAGKGTADVLVWGAGQFGSWGQLDHRAGAIAAEVGYQFNTKLKPWIRGGYFRSTGDGNPGDSDHTTFFQVLPTPRIYARTPFYNLMNNEDLFAQFRIRPHPRVLLRTDVRHLRLSNELDLWYSGGGAFQKNTFGYIGRPGGGRRSLGTMVDLSLDWNLTPKRVLTLYGAGVRGGGVQRLVYPEGGTNPGLQYFYVEFTERF
jgi:hypothetical protein